MLPKHLIYLNNYFKNGFYFKISFYTNFWAWPVDRQLCTVFRNWLDRLNVHKISWLLCMYIDRPSSRTTYMSRLIGLFGQPSGRPVLWFGDLYFSPRPTNRSTNSLSCLTIFISRPPDRPIAYKWLVFDQLLVNRSVDWPHGSATIAIIILKIGKFLTSLNGYIFFF